MIGSKGDFHIRVVLVQTYRHYPLSTHRQDLSSCHNACMTSPLETLPAGDPIGGVVYLRIILSPEEASHMCDISVFGKKLSRKSDNVVVFPFAFHIAVQQPFKPLWSRLLLYELEPSRASFALCFKPLLMALLPASVLVSLFV